MKRMGIFKRSPAQRIKQPTEKSRRVVITCHDCGKAGIIDLYRDGDHALPPGWAMAWVRLKPLYTCPACGEKRRRWVWDNIIRREPK